MFRLSAIGLVAAALVLVQDNVEDAWNNLLARALSADSAKDYAHAEPLFQQALHEAERFGNEDSRVATTLTSLGLDLRHQKKFSEAETALRRALTIIDKESDDESPEMADAEFNLAGAMVDGGHQAMAVPLLQKTLGVYESALGGFHQKTAAALCLLGDSYRLQKNFIEAERPLRRCADIRQANGGMSDLEFADALHSLALAYTGDGKYALAEPRFTLAEKIREKNLGITSPLLAQTMEDHAVLLRKLGREPEAARLTAMAAAILRANRDTRLQPR
jgi:tetratricopeptide (TPR) repeat protein